MDDGDVEVDEDDDEDDDDDDDDAGEDEDANMAMSTRSLVSWRGACVKSSAISETEGANVSAMYSASLPFCSLCARGGCAI